MLVHQIYFVTLLMVSENAGVQEAEETTKKYEPTQVLSPFSEELCKMSKYFLQRERPQSEAACQLIACLPELLHSSDLGQLTGDELPHVITKEGTQ